MIPASPTPDSYNLNSHQSGGRAPLPHSMKASQGKRRLLVPTGIEAIVRPYTSQLPCGSDGKAPACNAGDPGLIPGSGKSPGEGKGYPTPGKFHGQRWATVHGLTNSWTRLSD